MLYGGVIWGEDPAVWLRGGLPSHGRGPGHGTAVPQSVSGANRRRHLTWGGGWHRAPPPPTTITTTTNHQPPPPPPSPPPLNGAYRSQKAPSKGGGDNRGEDGVGVPGEGEAKAVHRASCSARGHGANRGHFGGAGQELRFRGFQISPGFAQRGGGGGKGEQGFPPQGRAPLW